MLANQRGFDIKNLAYYEILNYWKYIFDAEGFNRKSPKSELALEIENNAGFIINLFFFSRLKL